MSIKSILAKLITLYALFHLSTANAGKVYVFYLNGAFNVSESTATATAEKFHSIISSAGIYTTPLVGTTVEKITYWIPGSYSNDAGEIIQQQGLSEQALQIAKNANVSQPLRLSSEYRKALGKKYFDLIDGKLASSTGSSLFDPVWITSETTRNLANKINDLRKDGSKIVFVAHSQGNLYLEAALSYIEFKYGSAVMSNFRVLGLGAISVSSLNDEYVSYVQDQYVVSKGWLIKGNGVLFKPLEPYHKVCISPCADSTYTELAYVASALGDSNVHGAVKTYFNPKVIDYTTGQSSPTIIANQVKSYVRALAYFDRIKGKIPTKIAIQATAIAQNDQWTRKNTPFSIGFWVDSFIQKFIRSASAQSLALLSTTTKSTISLRVDGTGFTGAEILSIDGATCSTNIQRGSDFFVQTCTIGNVASTGLRIRIFDTQYETELSIPDAYKFIEVKGPILSPNTPTLSDLGSGSVRINWNTVSGASGYQVFRNGSQVANLGVTTQFDDSGVGQGVQACYRVRAVSGNTASSNSGETCITTAAAQCTNTWTGGYTSLGGQETTSGSCPSGQTGSITYRHTCGANGVWGATTQTSTCATPPSGTPSAPVVAPPTSCANSWNGGSTAIGGTDTRSLSCASGQIGSITERRTCGSGGVWGTTTQTSTCATPPPATCSKSWSTGTVNVGSVETRSYSCPSGQTGTLTESHTCTAANTWSSVTTSGTCTAVRCTGSTGTFAVGQVETTYQACSSGFTGQISSSRTCQANGSWSATTTNNSCSAVTCGGSWSSSRFNVGAVEDRYLNSCPAGSSGQVREFHTCQANGSWTATAQSDNCTPILVTPTSLYASNIASGVQLTWNAASGATSYFLYRNGSQIATVNSPGTAFVDTNVSNGVNYCYAIAAYSTFSNPPSTSARSNQYCQTYTASAVVANPPNNVAASQVTSPQKGIRLNWNIPSGSPDSFQIYRRDRTGVFAVVNGTDVSFTDWSSFSHTSGASYCYYMRSVKGSVVSLDSNEACSIAP